MNVYSKIVFVRYVTNNKPNWLFEKNCKYKILFLVLIILFHTSLLICVLHIPNIFTDSSLEY